MAGLGRFLQLILLVLVGVVYGDDDYLIGAGIGDVTGPAAEINMVSRS